MDYPCAKFGECTFSRFGFIMQTHSLSHTQRITDTAKCLTHATTVGVSNNIHVETAVVVTWMIFAL